MRAAALALLFIPAAMHAAPIDCAKASSPIEHAICSDPTLAAADRNLATAYRTDLSQLTSTSIGLLRADQIQWLAWVQQLCSSGDGTAACLQPLYTDRVHALRKAILHTGGLTFLTRTQYLATPDTEQSPDRSPHPGFGSLIATWPAADTTDDGWQAWNHALEARMIRLSSPENADPALTDWQDSMAEGLDSTVTATLHTTTANRVAASLTTETQEHGGAHPYEIFETLTFLLKEKRALRADDVFRGDANWKQVLAETCWKQLSTGDKKQYVYPEVEGPDAKEIQQVILDPRHWTLEADGLHISYPEYSVAPRYVGMDDAIIPWPQLQPLLNERFALP